jgi:hypothetical protein
VYLSLKYTCNSSCQAAQCGRSSSSTGSQIARQKTSEGFLGFSAEIDLVSNGHDPPSADLSRYDRPTLALLVLAQESLRFVLVADGGDFACRGR